MAETGSTLGDNAYRARPGFWANEEEPCECDEACRRSCLRMARVLGIGRFG